LGAQTAVLELLAAFDVCLVMPRTDAARWLDRQRPSHRTIFACFRSGLIAFATLRRESLRRGGFLSATIKLQTPNSPVLAPEFLLISKGFSTGDRTFETTGMPIFSL
jgi:hypothetical protein